jgi:predicted RNA-binding protein associated with RNAse of E/G family
MPAKSFHIVYPKDEILDADELESRYVDALAAGEIPPDEYGHAARTPEQMAIELENAGFIKLALDVLFD